MNKKEKELDEKEKQVIEKCGTEPRFSSELLEIEEAGTFKCKKCGQELFSSNHKYDSGTGWPSFYDVVKEEAVEYRKDMSTGNERTEVICSKCEGHLGHVFEDGPEDKTGKRYCINGIALEFEEKNE